MSGFLEEINPLLNIDLKMLDAFYLFRKTDEFMHHHQMENIENLSFKLHNEQIIREWFLNTLIFNETELFRDISMWSSLMENTLPLLHSNVGRVKILLPVSNSGPELITLLILLKKYKYLSNTEITACCFTSKCGENLKRGAVTMKKVAASEKNFEDAVLSLQLGDFISNHGHEGVLNFSFSDYLFTSESFLPVDTDQKYHLMIVRNRLLYLSKEAHFEFVEELDRRLNVGGFLVLGLKERIGHPGVENKYALVNQTDNIYRKIR